MKQHEPGDRVVEPGLHREVAHGNHQDLKRHEIAGDEDEEQWHGGTEPVDRQRESREARETQRHDHRRDRDVERVLQVRPRLGLNEDRRVVFDQHEIRRPAEHVAGVDVLGRADRGEHDRQHRQQPDEQGNRQRDLVERLNGGRGPFDGLRKHLSVLLARPGTFATGSS